MLYSNTALAFISRVVKSRFQRAVVFKAFRAKTAWVLTGYVRSRIKLALL